MKVIIVGMSGTGKSTLADALKSLGYEVVEDGEPSRDAYHLVLDAPASVCAERLAQPVHPQLLDSRRHFFSVSNALPQCALIDASGSPQETLRCVIEAFKDLDILPTRHVC